MRINKQTNYNIQVLENGYKLTSDNIVIVQIEPNIPYRFTIEDVTDYQKSAEKHIEEELNNPTFDNILSLEEISNKISDINDVNMYSLFKLLQKNNEEEIKLINDTKELLENSFNEKLETNDMTICNIMLDAATNTLNHEEIVNKIEDLRIDFEVEHIK